MKYTSKLLIILSFYCSTINCVKGQNTSGNVRSESIFKDFPYTKFVDITYSPSTSSDYRIKQEGSKIETGKLHEEKMRVNFLVPVYKKPGKFEILAGGSYKYQTYHFTEVENDKTNPSFFNLNSKEETHYFSGNLTGIYYAKIMNKLVVLNANLLVDGSNQVYERTIASFTATLPLYKSDKTYFALGAYFTTSHSRLLPLMPTLIYQHKIKDGPWYIDAVLPKSLYLRRMINERSRFSAGFWLDPSASFIYPDQKGFKQVYVFNKVEVKLDVKYEQNLNENFGFQIQGGISQPYKGVFRETNSSRNFADLYQDMNFYLNAGIFYKLKK